MSAILELPEAPARFEVPEPPAADVGTPALGLSDLFALPALRARVMPLSVKAYEALDELGMVDRHAELLEGIIVQKMPKTSLHCKLVKRIFLCLLFLERAGWVVFFERPLRLPRSMPEPDVMVARGGERSFDDKHPDVAALAVEVAVTSVKIDRAKAALYAAAGVLEYWIVLPKTRQVEVYRQPENGVYQQKQIFSADAILACTSVPDLQVPLAGWFA